MSKWAGKYVIALTGNIGTGKSVVRRMLEHLGAYGIDADTLSHRVIARGAPAYQPIVENFGRWVLGPDGEIDRKKIGKLVFSDPQALKTLEEIIHPYVLQAVDWMIRRSSQQVIVIEAIKIIETGLAKQCDSLWVTTVDPGVQIARLMKGRHISEAEARQRVTAQSDQTEKIKLAQVVIRNDRTFEDTWMQVSAAWRNTVLQKVDLTVTRPIQRIQLEPGQLRVQRGRPRDSEEIAKLVNRSRPKDPPLGKADLMAAFGEKAFLLLYSGQQLVGAAGWQVENLIARMSDIVFDPAVTVSQALPTLMKEMEQASKDLQCEASLVFVPSPLAREETLWRELGYEQRTSQSLGVMAWQEAAQESMPEGSTLLFKQLREDRVLRPI